MRVSIVGGSGYTGGEVLRLLLGHPQVEVAQITSESLAGEFASSAHPNLRGRAQLAFVPLSKLEPCDALFLCLPHGVAQGRIDQFRSLAPRLIDLSADFRLQDSQEYRRWYRHPHPRPELLPEFVYGLPELHREKLRSAQYASGVGCNAAATILGLYPLVRAGLKIERIVTEVKVGSSEGGNDFSAATHHPERSGALRSFAPTGHRHSAEVKQALGPIPLHFSATAVEMVRGVLATSHVFVSQVPLEKDLWKIYRTAYHNEPFLRLVNEKRGIHRYPDPKILIGSNYCDVGFAADPEGGRIVVMAAIDNLMKGASGSAVQCFNLMCGFPETLALEFPGLHPI